MQVTVRLFAILRERAGASVIEMTLPADSTAATAIENVLEQFPALAPHLAKSATAINRSYAPRDTQLQDGDELALIPPVSGG